MSKKVSRFRWYWFRWTKKLSEIVPKVLQALQGQQILLGDELEPHSFEPKLIRCSVQEEHKDKPKWSLCQDLALCKLPVCHTPFLLLLILPSIQMIEGNHIRLQVSLELGSWHMILDVKPLRLLGGIPDAFLGKGRLHLIWIISFLYLDWLFQARLHLHQLIELLDLLHNFVLVPSPSGNLD